MACVTKGAVHPQELEEMMVAVAKEMEKIRADTVQLVCDRLSNPDVTSEGLLALAKRALQLSETAASLATACYAAGASAATKDHGLRSRVYSAIDASFGLVTMLRGIAGLLGLPVGRNGAKWEPQPSNRDDCDADHVLANLASLLLGRPVEVGREACYYCRLLYEAGIKPSRDCLAEPYFPGAQARCAMQCHRDYKGDLDLQFE